MADEDKITLPDWYFWPDWRFEYENRQFELRCYESMVKRMQPSCPVKKS